MTSFCIFNKYAAFYKRTHRSYFHVPCFTRLASSMYIFEVADTDGREQDDSDKCCDKITFKK
jgi:hypothetical protein